METIADLMNPNPIVVKQDRLILECATLMVRHHVRHLPVVDGDGGLAGVVQDFDVFNRGGLIGADLEMWVSYEEGDEALTARDIAVAPNVVVSPDDLLLPVLRHLLSTRQDGGVVVDEDKRVVGIITEHDGVRLAQAVLSAKLTATHEGNRSVFTVDKEDPAGKALDLMTEHRIRHVVVTSDGKLHGVLSWRDLIEDDIQRGRKLSADDVMRERKNVHTVTRDTPLLTAAETMAEHEIGCLPVVNDEGRPVGILTRTDLIAASVAALENEDLFANERE